MRCFGLTEAFFQLEELTKNTEKIPVPSPTSVWSKLLLYHLSGDICTVNDPFLDISVLCA